MRSQPSKSEASSGARSTILAFVEKINAHDVEGLADLMSEDHLSVDSLGRVQKGREKMCEGWRGYFVLFPDYNISVMEIFEKDDTFVLLGTARGTYSVEDGLSEENSWEIPAAWKAVVKNGHVTEWHVFADNYKTVKLLQSK